MRTAVRGGSARAVIAALALLLWSATALATPWLLAAPALDLRSAGEVTRILPLPGGGAIVAGSFQQMDGAPRNLRLAKLLPDGSLDSQWNPPGVQLDFVADMVLDEAGFVFVGGNVYAGVTTYTRIFKFSTSGVGAAAPGWQTQSYPNGTYVSALALDGAGHLYIAGTLSEPPSGTGIRRVSAATGALDPAWAMQSDEGVNDLHFGTDDRLYLARHDTFAAAGSLRRLDPALNGVLDPDWNPPVGQGTVARGIVVGTDGFVYARGDLWFNQGGQGYTRGVARIAASPDASLDTQWLLAQPDGPVTDMALSGDGQLLLSGDFSGFGATDRPRLARVSTTGAGTVDPAWPPLQEVSGTLEAVAPFGSNVLIGGLFHAIDDQPMLSLARIDATSVQPVADAEERGGRIRTIAVQADGAVVIGGRFHKIGDLHRQGLARVAANGSVDPAWVAQVDGEVTSLALADGHLYVGGGFHAIDGEPRTGIARLLVDGQLDAWAPVLTRFGDLQPYVLQLLADDQGKLYALGAFSSIDGMARVDLARFDRLTGQWDWTWTPPILAGPAALAVLGEHVVLAASALGGPSNLLRVSRAGSGAIDATWLPGVAGPVAHMHAAADGHLYVSGSFSAIGGVPRHHLARFLPTPAAELDPAWQPLPGTPPYVIQAMTTAGDGYLYVGAYTIPIPPESRGRVLRFATSGTGAADPAFDRSLDRPVHALAPAAGNRLLVGGAFLNIGFGISALQRRGLAAYALTDPLFVNGFEHP